MSAEFELGAIVATPGALQDFGLALIAQLLTRHAKGDWGDLHAHDRRENERGVSKGFRIFSAYDTPAGRAWIITEADRSSTCVLRPGITEVEVYTSRYLNFDLLSSGVVVPVRVSMHPPLIPLPYELKDTARWLVPEPWMVGEWTWLSPTYWTYLDGQGVEKIGKELEVISERYGGKPLALLDYEDLTKGHRSLRVVFSAW